MNQHHPDEALLLEYTAGTLSEPRALCVRLHLAQCSRCRSQVDLLNSLGAVLLDNRMARMPVPTPAPAANDALFARILGEIDQPAPRPEKPHPRGDLLQRVLGAPLDELPWKRQLGAVSVYDLSERLGSHQERVVLQRLDAGGKAPVHTHRGDELTLVLAGGFMDETGVFEEGDLVLRDTQHVHTPEALHGEDCVTLSVLSAPVRLTGRFMRLLNPFIR
mgnify:CR=1 FL=1